MIIYDIDGDPVEVRTISDTIKMLQDILAEHGDLPVCHMEDESDEGFVMNFEEGFEMIEIPNDPEDRREDAPMHKVCAFCWPELPEPHLKVIRDEQ